MSELRRQREQQRLDDETVHAVENRLLRACSLPGYQISSCFRIHGRRLTRGSQSVTRRTPGDLLSKLHGQRAVVGLALLGTRTGKLWHPLAHTQEAPRRFQPQLHERSSPLDIPDADAHEMIGGLQALLR